MLLLYYEKLESSSIEINTPVTIFKSVNIIYCVMQSQAVQHHQLKEAILESIDVTIANSHLAEQGLVL